jgi:hypothetical protein
MSQGTGLCLLVNGSSLAIKRRALLKTFAFFLWLLSFTATLFILATDVWQGDPLWPFVDAVALGAINPLGTWAIAKTYPQNDRAAWVCIGLTGGAVGIAAGLRLVVLL